MDIRIQCDYSSAVKFFNNVADLQSKIHCSPDNKINIHLPDSSFLNNRTNLFLLACLIALGEQNKKDVYVDVKFDNYRKNDEFIRFFQLNENTDIINLVRNNISTNVPIQMSETFEEEFISSIAEIYNNAREHSNATFIMGICYKPCNEIGREKFCFCCYDTGIGIIGNVRHFLGFDQNSLFKSYKANIILLEWALTDGETLLSRLSNALGV